MKPTINDVARIAGVSKKTVSRVINRSPLLGETTRRKVEAVIAELGYRPNPQARALALRRNFLFCMIYDNPNAQTVLRFQEGVLDTLRDTEFALMVHPVDRSSPHLLADVRTMLERHRPAGVIILPPVSENNRLARLCQDLGCPYVRLGSAILDDEAHLVSSRDREAVLAAVTHLAALGHRRIAFISGPANFRSAQEREAGYDEAVAGCGLDCEPRLKARGGYTFESGVAAAAALLRLPDRPTAIFASNDEMAAGTLHAAREAGLAVPEDLSVAGFDDAPIAAQVWPPITTVRWPIPAMARAATIKLTHPEQADTVRTSFLPELVLRQSVQAPAK